MYYLLKNALNIIFLKYLVPFLLNQSGSILFYIALAYSSILNISLLIKFYNILRILLLFTDISLVVPVTNSLTLFFTTLTGILLGEQQLKLSK
jgi:hypothetical protein